MVTDLRQAEIDGNLADFFKEKIVSENKIYAELSEIVTGKKNGRRSDDELIIFASTGIAICDLAVANVVYKLASGERHRHIHRISLIENLLENRSNNIRCGMTLERIERLGDFTFSQSKFDVHVGLSMSRVERSLRYKLFRHFSTEWSASSIVVSPNSSCSSVMTRGR